MTSDPPTLRCTVCNAIVTQSEADEANEIYPSQHIHCLACADAFADDEIDEPDLSDTEP